MFPFINHGLEKGEAAIYVSNEQSPRQIVKDMSTSGIDVGNHEKTGALRVLASKEWYVEDEVINKALVYKKWMKALSRVTEKGSSGLRFSFEPACFFQKNALRSCMEFEKLLPRRFNFPITVVCRYKTGDIVSNGMSYLLKLVKIHSHLITSKSVQAVDLKNFFAESVHNTFKHIFCEAGTQAVYYFLEHKYNLPKNNIEDHVELFNEALNNLFGSGGRFLQKKVFEHICSKLGLTFNPKE